MIEQDDRARFCLAGRVRAVVSAFMAAATAAGGGGRAAAAVAEGNHDIAGVHVHVDKPAVQWKRSWF